MIKAAIGVPRSASGKRLAFSEKPVIGAPRSAFGKNSAFSFQRSAFSKTVLGWAVAVAMLGAHAMAPAQLRQAGSAANRKTPDAARDASVPKALDPYTSCVFPDGLRIVQTSSLGQGPMTRPIQTASGVQNVDLDAGEQVVFSYPLTDDFANAKVELLPAAKYVALKQTLIDNVHFLEHQKGGPTPALALPVGLHGFEVHGNDVRRLDGNVLGMYVLFDDKAHVATTIYFLNQKAWSRKFQTMDEYGRLRDKFLRTYTGCVRENQGLQK